MAGIRIPDFIQVDGTNQFKCIVCDTMVSQDEDGMRIHINGSRHIKKSSQRSVIPFRGDRVLSQRSIQEDFDYPKDFVNQYATKTNNFVNQHFQRTNSFVSQYATKTDDLVTFQTLPNGRVCIELPKDRMNEAVELLSKLLLKSDESKEVSTKQSNSVSPKPSAPETTDTSTTKIPQPPGTSTHLRDDTMHRNMLVSDKSDTKLFVCNACNTTAMSWDSMLIHCDTESHKTTLQKLCE